MTREQVRQELIAKGIANPTDSLINGWWRILNEIDPPWLRDVRERAKERAP